MNKRAFGYLVVWRVLSVYIVQTSDVPDEYWQSLEVAHNLAFGYGHLTWEWRHSIRSYIYPFLISILYKILELLGLDFPGALINAPRVCQAVLSAYADYRFYIWTRSTWSTFVLTLNWFWYYCASRTLTNTVETALTTIALSTFPWRASSSPESPHFLWIVGITCAIRPTMAITWLPLCAYHLLTTSKTLPQALLPYFVIGLTTLTYSIAIDTYCYNHLVLTQWEFFKVNILNNIAGFYGTHHPLWYFTSALPVLLGVYVIYLPIAAYQVLRHSRISSSEFILLFTILWTISVYSLLEHKELRFILPILPMIIFVCTCTKIPDVLKASENLRRIFIGVFVLTNLIPLSYFSFVHQRGTLEVMRVLRQELGRLEGSHGRRGVDVMFLTPCHALPLYSHLHRNVTTKFLGCEPNLGGEEGYVDEAEGFFEEPMGWIERTFGGDRGWEEEGLLPRFVVLFDNVEGRVQRFLGFYELIARRLNAHISQGNNGKYIGVYRLKLVRDS
ncbi:GPI mannosyltransferase 3 [Diachasma alloeum]|uniref:GPI mannosyltransferase 3 n=1 Tax=Diachasma alloeum TaxID=454923 RepID=UPI00073849B8|nr:GPI mannosyltransferase 3 [Diachasma alloeum]